MNSGIYKITNLVNDKFYIGSSKDLERRKKEHFNHLRKNKHCNSHLQRSWNKYGEENFKFEVCLFCPEYCLLDIENSYLSQRPYYNIASKAGGGDTISKHPNKNKIIEKAQSTRRSLPRTEDEKSMYFKPSWIENQTKSNSKTPIKLIHKDTKEEFIFRNSKEAAKFVGCNPGQIRNCKLKGWKAKRLYSVVDHITLINE